MKKSERKRTEKLMDLKHPKLSNLKKEDWFMFPKGKKVYVYEGKSRYKGHPFTYYDFDDIGNWHKTKTDRKIVFAFCF